MFSLNITHIITRSVLIVIRAAAGILRFGHVLHVDEKCNIGLTGNFTRIDQIARIFSLNITLIYSVLLVIRAEAAGAPRFGQVIWTGKKCYRNISHNLAKLPELHSCYFIEYFRAQAKGKFGQMLQRRFGQILGKKNKKFGFDLLYTHAISQILFGQRLKERLGRFYGEDSGKFLKRKIRNFGLIWEKCGQSCQLYF